VKNNLYILQIYINENSVLIKHFISDLSIRYGLNFFIWFLISIFIVSCKDSESPTGIIFIPTTIVTGPGGPAYLSGSIKDYIHTNHCVLNTHIYVLKQQDYSDTLVHLFVNSTDASFRITNMPIESVDLIFENGEYLCTKIGKLNLKPEGNSFYNPFSSGYFIDSTVYITNIADSIGRPDAPLFGLQGYGPGLSVYYKSETPDSVGWNIVLLSSCDTIVVYRYDDPIFDPYENDIYILKCIDCKTVPGKLKYFNWYKEVLESDASYQFIQQ
jgi:hypothetical protein